MPRTYSDCSEEKSNIPNSQKGFGSLPFIFESRKHSQLVKKVESANTEYIHYIKHIPLRLTRTRPSCQLTNVYDFTDSIVKNDVKNSSGRSSIEFDLFSKGFCHSNSLYHDDETILSHSSDVILTPFAQILSNLHIIREDILGIGRQQKAYNDIEEEKIENDSNDDFNTKRSINISETCHTLDWCLRTLESFQTQRSISDMTAIKFQRILNNELNDKKSSDIQFCDYISNTFLKTSISNEESFLEETEFLTEEKLQDLDLSNLKNKKYEDFSLIEKIESSIDFWGFDLFEIKGHTDNVLTLTVFSIFQRRQFLSKFNISDDTLLNFLFTVEQNYRNVPYHNSIHAADVTQSSHFILNSIGLKDLFTDLEMLAVIFASAIHDVDHPGVSNQFLINTNDPLAILYNDHSVLENHHLATAFRLLGEKKCDILSNINKVEKLKFRKMVIDMVLATDMSCHISLLADLKTMIETKKVTGSGLLNLDNYHNKIKILQCLIHCSDLSNPTKPLPIYQKWVTRILDEFHIQGDKERDMGLDISPMCDRYILADDKTQVGFIDYIVHPLWNTWCDLVNTDIENIIQNLKENRSFYFAKMKYNEIKENSE